MEYWLQCKIGPGMFSDERVVTYRDYSSFIPVEHIDEDRGRVRVKRAGERHPGGIQMPDHYGSLVFSLDKDLELIRLEDEK